MKIGTTLYSLNEKMQINTYKLVGFQNDVEPNLSNPIIKEEGKRRQIIVSRDSFNRFYYLNEKDAIVAAIDKHSLEIKRRQMEIKVLSNDKNHLVDRLKKLL